MVAVSQRTIVITGASTGIGQACALHLDKLGFQVLAGVRQDRDAESLRQKASERLSPIFLDITDASSIASAAKTVENTVGAAGLYGLVNNAGIVVTAPLEFLPLAEFRRQMEVSVIGHVAVTQSLMPLLRIAQGRIVNMSSIGGRFSAPFLGPYHASKFALTAITDSLRMELQPWGIRVVLIEPGPVVTPIWEKSLTEADKMQQNLPPEAEELYGRAMEITAKTAALISRSGISPDTVARTVAHVLTTGKPKSRYLVGQFARSQALFNLLPDRLRDRLTLKLMGL
jgi:NAD(P)-dependent dehydrogenase (short-subunit alcohol dehydrogenase family)